ncbi:ABC transporter ATP-binding protein [Georgenia satyanarayanai]|uniref:ABC transporter ATP-binding protein n=1 Tax=Georgenia satyanarayanai TaxID=860221 RepID=UPI00203E8184|nr:ABC transporter ATP-binding protein [Georgenia satyanarayanai]MCM3662076.1 ABC transporter ATP-binding protein [Georgenia satyanarayanai]
MSDLVLDQLVAHRGRPLFAPVDAVVTPGTLLGLVGPNGAGKSSLLSAVVGNGVRSTGAVRYGDADLHRMRPRRLAQVLSYMTQDSYAPNELRVRDVVAVGALATPETGSVEQRAFEALERLGVGDLADRSYAHLSGGERQLVQVARVVAQAAPVMLLDEPTSALDLGHQLTVMHVLREHANAGHVVVVTMHDLTQALRWADRVAVVADGAVVHGPPHEVITAELVRRVYGVTVEVFSSPAGSPTLSLVRPSCPTAATYTRHRPVAVRH